MCGICGKINTRGKSIPRELLASMTVALSHRGPDDAGYYESNGDICVALGHRRLSIVDLSPAGHQPMCNEDQSIWLVFNGEIYNHPQLRQELKSKGHRFSSNSDSEVILHLYEERGIDCLKQLNGMFAFCLWDAKEQTLYLCRDRVGIKPLVYAWDGQNLVFASQIKSILCDPSITKDLDHQALDLYLTLNYIPAPFTIYQDIRKLEPGHYLKLTNTGVSLTRFWDIAPQISSEKLNPNECASKLYGLLNDAVKLQGNADVPLGAFLSGGLDSSIVVGLMAKASPTKIKTFTVGFADMPMYDERAYARLVAQRFQTDHTEINLHSQGMINSVEDVLKSFDEPFGDSSAICTHVVSKETRRHVKVALSGDGGDELFAGYRMYAGESLYVKYKQIPKGIRTKLIEPLINFLPDSRESPLLDHVRRLKKFIAGSSEIFEERFFLWNQIISHHQRFNLYKHPPRDMDLAKHLMTDLLNTTKTDNINRMLYCDFKNSLPNDMLTKVDWMSMKNSLEVRVPLLDHNVVEQVFQMQGDLKFHHGKGKAILLEAFKDLLPKELLTRPKSGFEVPISQWLKSDLRFLIDEHLSPANIKHSGLFQYDTVKQLVDDHLHNRKDNGWQIWNLIVFQEWHSR